MEKTAKTDHPIHPLLASRWSPRAFDDRDVPDEALASLFEAARWAPSCFNEQPWHFIVARRRDPEAFERLVKILVEANGAWADKAPVLLLSVAALRFASNDKPNRHALHDVGLAVGAMTVQASELGLSMHQMAGFDVEKARLVYRIPSGFEPTTVIAIGYRGDATRLPDKLRERETMPRARKPLGEFVFDGSWGAPAV